MPLVELTPMLPVADTLTGAELVPVMQDGLPVQSTTQDIANLAVLGDTVDPTEITLPVLNETGGTLTAGTLVYVNDYDATTGKSNVAKADADGSSTYPATWVVTADIADSAAGTVRKGWTVTGLDTSGASAVGSLAYLDTTAGGFTFTAPTGATATVQPVGTVTVKDATVGAIKFDLLSFLTRSWGTNNMQAVAVTVAKGGTGIGTLTAAGAIPTGGAGGTAAMVPIQAVAAGQVLTSAGTATIPAWAGTSVPISGVAPQLVLGAVAASSAGAIDFKGSTSGTTRLAVTAVAGAVTVTLPTVATNGPTAQAAAGQVLVSDASGNQSYVATPGSSGNVLTSNGSAWTSAAAATTTGVLVGYQVLTVGSGTYSATAGATVALFEAVGAGGGGGGADGDVAQFGAGGGGGGGGYASKRFTTLTGITYTAGAGGAGGTAGNNAGQVGADTTFTQSAVVTTAKGGLGGGSQAAGATIGFPLGGAGGAVATNGTLNAGGQAGTCGLIASAANIARGGAGGGSHYGGGGLGGVNDAVGAAAASFGAGGGGAAANSATDRAGGNGSDGVIVVWEYK